MQIETKITLFLLLYCTISTEGYPKQKKGLLAGGVFLTNDIARLHSAHEAQQLLGNSNGAFLDIPTI